MTKARKKLSVNEAWEILFSELSIIERIERDGVFEISSQTINGYHEARLMVKFDFRAKRPKIFIEHGLSILPITTGTYVIGKFNIYEDILYDSKLETIGANKLPDHITAIDIENISSETTALLCANVCGILTSFFEEDYITHVIGGRMRTGDFRLQLSNVNLSVSSSQIEIDGGFESESCIYLVEVKNLMHDNFLVRQVYYPYRAWTSKLEEQNIDKKVRNIFLTYSDGDFYLREYVFEHLEKPESIKMIKEAKYSIIKESLSLEKLQYITDNVAIVEDPNSPFPQSDDLNKVINLCELLYLKDEKMTKAEVSEEFGFVIRQANYYGTSTNYLDLTTYENNKYSLTKKGEKIFRLPLQQRQLELVSLILSHEPFNIVMKDYLQQGERPSIDRIQELIRHCKLYNVGKETTTFPRRCKTVISWIDWIFDRVDI